MKKKKKTFHRPISNFQIFHRGAGNLYFLLVTDLSDSLDYVDKSLKKILEKFKQVFPSPEQIQEMDQEKSEFIEFLKIMQAELHSKITIIGPVKSGKTTFYNLFKSEQERKIMNFAKSTSIQIDNLSFDLWDFQLQDNFSLLWSKFIKGSDLAIMLIDASNYNLKTIENFKNLQKIDGKFSRLLSLATKRDLIEEDELKKIKNQLELPDLNFISLHSQQAKTQILNWMREVMQLKKPLPDNFEILREEAKKLEHSDQFTPAIAKYRELIKICNEFQNFSYIEEFEKIIGVLKNKREEEREKQKEFARKKKFEAPKKIKFKSDIKVKNLPSVQPLPTSKNGKTTKMKTRGKNPSEKSKTTLKPGDVQLDIPNLKEKQVDDKKSKLSPELTGLRKLSDEEIFNESSDFPEKIYKLIAKRGGVISRQLSELYVEELINELDRPLKFNDLLIAADKFVQKQNQG